MSCLIKVIYRICLYCFFADFKTIKDCRDLPFTYVINQDSSFFHTNLNFFPSIMNVKHSNDSTIYIILYNSIIKKPAISVCSIQERLYIDLSYSSNNYSTGIESPYLLIISIKNSKLLKGEVCFNGIKLRNFNTILDSVQAKFNGKFDSLGRKVGRWEYRERGQVVSWDSFYNGKLVLTANLNKYGSIEKKVTISEDYHKEEKFRTDGTLEFREVSTDELIVTERWSAAGIKIWKKVQRINEEVIEEWKKEGLKIQYCIEQNNKIKCENTLGGIP